MRLSVATFPLLVILGSCAHAPPTSGCHIESGWMDSSNGCLARAGYPDCYRVCPDGSRVRVQNQGDVPGTAAPGSAAPGSATDPQAAPH